MCVEAQVSIHIYFFKFCQLRRPKGGTRSNDAWVAIGTSSTNVLVSKYVLKQKKPRLLEEVVDSRTGGRKPKMTLAYYMVSESKEVLKIKRNKKFYNMTLL